MHQSPVSLGASEGGDGDPRLVGRRDGDVSRSHAVLGPACGAPLADHVHYLTWGEEGDRFKWLEQDYLVWIFIAI